MEKKIKVLVVDDSAFMRKFIGDIIKEDSSLELVGTVRTGEELLKKREKIAPDVITLDVEMPGLGGLETLRKIMKEAPLPVIMVSSLTREGSDTTIEALSAGAVDFITKPSLVKGESPAEISKVLPEKIRAAAEARVKEQRGRSGGAAEEDLSSGSHPVSLEPKTVSRSIAAAPFRLPARHIVAIGTSTGGPKALEVVMQGLPKNLPAAVLITQHMPAGFTESLARRLDRVSPLQVAEAQHGVQIADGHAYLAKGGYHLVLNKNGELVLSSADPVQHVRPSVDVMMESLVQIFGGSIVGVILTGMGRDGTEGVKLIKEKGGKAIAQEPSTAVIPSMPQSAINSGQVDAVVPLEKVAEAVCRMLS